MAEDGVTHEQDEVGTLNEDPGSMAFKLARMQAAEAPPQKSPEEEAAEAARLESERVAAEEQAAEAAAEVKTETPEGEVTETAEEKAAREAAEAEAAKPKFQTVDEWAKGYKEAEKKMHTATQETAAERKAREAAEERAAAAERERDELRQKEQERLAAEEAAKAQPRIKERYAEALKKIREIPLTTNEEGQTVYPENYDDLVADAWAGTGVDPVLIAQEAAKIAREQIAQEETAKAAKVAEAEKATRAEQVRGQANKMATDDYGLDMTEGSADHRIFYTFVNEMASDPKHEMIGKPFEEQVKWAAEGTRKLLGKKIEMTDAERAAAAAHQRRVAPLERGITRHTPPEPPKQRSMNEILTGLQR